MKFADKPLFRDPVLDGAADPVVIYHRQKGTWLLVYTARRANVPGLPGVSWCHGTPLGVAESTDGGNSWAYRGNLTLPFGTPEDSFWAPEILWHDGLYHMFVTFVPGMHTDWSGTREIHHVTSPDFIQWTRQSQLALSSDKVIDACVFRLPDGVWRLWYNNERDGKSIYYADSTDLFHWHDKGKATDILAVGEGGEGPYVFHWHGYYWMIVDVWRGLAVYRSTDAATWVRQPERLLETPGTGIDDGRQGGHGMVQVADGRAYLFYFTHPGRTLHGDDAGTTETRRSSIQVAELECNDGWLTCDRNRPVPMALGMGEGRTDA